jgi:hypothetical protein
MRFGLIAVVAAVIGLAPAAKAQDLYDQDLFRPFELTFHLADWWNLLLSHKDDGLYIPADLTVDGVTYPDVGVRLRGQASFSCAPGKKKPFRIKMDAFVPDQELYGHDSFRLNNGAGDPTFLREALMAEALRQYIPMARRAFTNLGINGENWGVYIIEQQKDGRYAQEFFGSGEGNRYKAIWPNGLTYHGTDPNSYLGRYEHVNGPTPDSYKDLIVFLDALNNTPLGSPLVDALLPVVDMDAALWMFAGNALFGNLDSYQGLTHNYYVLFDAHQERFYVQTHDLDLSFGTYGTLGTDTLLTKGFNVTKRSLVFRPWKHKPFRQEFWAHVKTMAEDTFDWEKIGPLAWKWHNMIDAAVAADTKKMYPYKWFQNGITQDVGGNGACWTFFPGLQRWVEERQAYTLSLPNVVAPRVELSFASHEPAQPDPGQPVTVAVSVVGQEPASKVRLRYRAGPGGFKEVPMRDDGASGDGAAGDGVYGGKISGQAPGAVVEYLVVATGATDGTKTFLPRKSEQEPFVYGVVFGEEGLRITEYMYSGTDGELIELTNTSSTPIDVTGWSIDDQTGAPGTFDLSAAGVVQPGESVVITDGDAATFTTAWNLAGVTVLGGNIVAKLGRNDAVYVFDAAGALVDRLAFGDEDFPGSPRARDASAWACTDGLGMDDALLWTLSSVGDPQGSWVSVGGDEGSPGTWNPADCPSIGVDYCSSNPNSTGLAGVLTAEGSAALLADDLTLNVVSLPVGQVGYFLMSDVQANVPGFGGSQGVLCIGAPLLRFVKDVLTVDAGGQVSFPLEFGNLPGGTSIQAGETWNFQLWYRDVNPSPTSNTSNGLAITFE